MATDIRRRKFISILGSAAVWPFALRAQPADKMRRVGVLPGGYRETDPEGQARIAAFLDTLRKLGWSDGRNVRIEVQWSSTEMDRIREETAAVVGSAPDVIVISSNGALAILQKLEKTISTVFVQISDPVGSGFVSSLAHPDGNLTGFQNFEPAIGGKWLGLLKEVAPRIARAAIIVHPDTAIQFEFVRAVEAVAPSLGVQVSVISVRDWDETERGIARFADVPDAGLIVLPHPGNTSNRALFIDLTARLRLPAIYPYNFFATSGGLISYGFDQIGQWRGAAGYVDRILRGAKPADLPVQAPTKYELVINLKTANGLGLTISPALLATADQVIE
jgi:putative tryptophan/tyrosine transport system substrate-binding protein